MAPQHQNPEEAVQGMKLCNAAFAAGCHWGTFQLTDEPIDEPVRKLAEALDAEGLPRERFRAMRPGEVWDVPNIDIAINEAVYPARSFSKTMLMDRPGRKPMKSPCGSLGCAGHLDIDRRFCRRNRRQRRRSGEGAASK